MQALDTCMVLEVEGWQPISMDPMLDTILNNSLSQAVNIWAQYNLDQLDWKIRGRLKISLKETILQGWFQTANNSFSEKFNLHL